MTTATQPTAPVTRGWCHCADSPDCHYLLDGAVLCGAALVPVRPFVVSMGRRKGDVAPKCVGCDRAHVAKWRKGGIRL